MRAEQSQAVRDAMALMAEAVELAWKRDQRATLKVHRAVKRVKFALDYPDPRP